MLRDLLLPLLLLTCAGSPAHASEASDDAPRPNLILFLVDDLGWRDHGLPEREGFGPNEGAGQERFHTPHLERLAERGLVFTDGYASAPVCTPTRTSIQTGMSPGQSHITYWTQYAGRDTSRKHPRLAPPAWRTDGLDADEVTLAKLLRDAGYRTIHVGKAHFGAKGSACEDPTAVGFVRNVAGHAAGAPGSFLSEHAFTASGRQGRQQHEPSYWDVPGLEAYHDSGTYLTEALAREAVSEIDEAVAAGEPFFLNFAPYAVHTPIMANPALLDERYAGLDPQEAAYATMIESVDDALGAIVAKLDELGIADETALFYTSDNGGLSAHARGRMPDDTGRHHHNAPLLSGKGSAYEGGIRVPWVVRWPGMEEELVGAISNQVIVSHDLFPTFLNLAGVKMPEEHAPKVEGMDIPGLIDQADLRGAPVARLVPWHQPHQWGANGPGIEPFTAVRHGAFKLILFHDGPRYELYDLARDPGEARDLFASRNHFGWRRALALATTAWALGREVQPSRSHGQASMTPPGPVDVADVQEAWYELTLRGPLRDTTQRPNILWITVDDLGWADLSGTASTLGHGSSLHKTPHTDRLAERGLAFPRAYAAAPNCAPSRASMWTGLWPARTGVYTVGEPNRGRAELRSLEAASNTTTLPDELLTITERLPRPYGSGSSSSLSGGSTSGYPGYPERPFGYQSIHLGKWHLGGGRGARTAPGDPLAQGFHDNIGGDARGNPGGVQFADDEGRFPLPGLERAGEPSQWIDDRLGDELLRVLERLTARAGDWVGDGRFPFFANLSLYAVHTPVRPTAEDRAAFDDARIPAGSRHDDLEYAAYVKGYDDVVGDVIAKLEELDDPRWPGHKLIENTIVVLTSDNGGGSDNYTGTVFDDAASGSIVAGSAPFTGTYAPEEPLSTFAGENTLGAWSLQVVDDFNADGGTINAWSLDFTLDMGAGAGSSDTCAAESCLAVLTSNSGATDSTYWLDNGFGAYEAYCDMTNGGWTLLMKASGDSTFGYSDALWEDLNLLNAANPSVDTSTNAKYQSFTDMPFTELEGCFPTEGGTCITATFAETTAQALFSGSAQQVGTGFDGQFYAPWSTQPNCQWFGINSPYNYQAVRFGFTANQENDCNTNDTAVGFGVGPQGTTGNAYGAGELCTSSLCNNGNVNGGFPGLLWGR